jgi:hypothetical protein
MKYLTVQVKTTFFKLTLPVRAFHSRHDEVRIDLADGGGQAHAHAAGYRLTELSGSSRYSRSEINKYIFHKKRTICVLATNQHLSILYRKTTERVFVAISS